MYFNCRILPFLNDFLNLVVFLTFSVFLVTVIQASFILYIHSNLQGVMITPYSGFIFGGVIFTPKRSLKNSFSGVKMTPDIEVLK